LYKNLGRGRIWGHSPLSAHPQKCGVRLRLGQISAGCLVCVYFVFTSCAIVIGRTDPRLQTTSMSNSCLPALIVLTLRSCVCCMLHCVLMWSDSRVAVKQTRIPTLTVVTGAALLSLSSHVLGMLSVWATSGVFLTSSMKMAEVRRTAKIFYSLQIGCS